MSRDGSAPATRPEPFAPKVIALDPVLDSLDAFAPEARPAARSGPGPATRLHPDRVPVITVRVPQRMVALVAALCGAIFLAVVVSAVTAAPAAPPAPRSGTITITSEPSGVPVSVDGVARGATPFTAVLTAGTHEMDIGIAGRARRRVVHVSPGGVSSMHIEWPLGAVAAPVPDTPPSRVPSPASPGDADADPTPVVTATAVFRSVPTGWVSIASAFPVRVFEDRVDLRVDGAGRLALSEGTHRLVLVNDALDFRQERQVTIAARRGVTMPIDTPRGTLHVNAQPWAEVYVDGRLEGETPLGNLSLPIGAHEVVLKHPRLGEVSRTVTVGARTPARLGVAFHE